MHDENIPEGQARELADAAQSITQKIVSGLKEAVSKSDAAEPRLLFPNGIELIDVGVKVGAADVVVKIAGAKGIKGEVVQVREATATSPYLRDASECDDTDPLAHGRKIRWVNFSHINVTIKFGANGSPLENNYDNFPVPAGGGVVDTKLRQDLPPGSTYPYNNPPVTCGRGMPRIIIQ